jgi:hypothetical protein
MNSLKEITEIVHNIVVIIAALIGGAWVLLRLRRERVDEAAVEISVSTTSTPLGSEHLAVITAELTNKGHTEIRGRTEKTSDGLVYKDTADGGEELKYSCSLQIRSVDVAALGATGRLPDWFKRIGLIDIPGVPRQIDLLTEYVDPDKNKLEFWAEPGEVYRLRSPVLLPVGTYMAKVTFVGADSDRQEGLLQVIEDIISPRKKGSNQENFWSQFTVFTIPCCK